MTSWIIVSVIYLEGGEPGDFPLTAAVPPLKFQLIIHIILFVNVVSEAVSEVINILSEHAPRPPSLILRMHVQGVK